MIPANGSKNARLIFTGIQELDEILSSEAGMNGIVVHAGPKNDFETPIIIVNGAPGTGKTVLSMQIAHQAAGGPGMDQSQIVNGSAQDLGRQIWVPFYLALEQSVQSLKQVAENFDSFRCAPIKEKDHFPVHYIELSEVFTAQSKNSPMAVVCNTVYFSYLSPRPISASSGHDVYENRLGELNHLLETMNRVCGEGIRPLIFLDSLNAFSSDTLTRNQVYRLFSLFRAYKIPAFITIEQHQDAGPAEIISCEDSARFLSDVSIRLSKEIQGGYLHYYLEVEKSRISRQTLGRHLYKIRTHTYAENISVDDRTGMVLYPSIHSILSKSRVEKTRKAPPFIISHPAGSLRNVIESNSVFPGNSFSIIGPRGTHKLALGLNLAMGRIKGKPTKLLILNFSGSPKFKIRGAAWAVENVKFKKLLPIRETEKGIKGGSSHLKFWTANYSLRKSRGKRKAIHNVTVVTFRIGQLMSEECFYVIDQLTKPNEKGEMPYSSVLISDISELCDGFPAVAADPLFLPALIELCTMRNMVTVSVGVDAPQSVMNNALNFSIVARADHRITLLHYPETRQFVNNLGEVKKKEGSEEEQMVCMIVDIVTSKNYGRRPKWMWVKNKVLYCSPKIRKAAPVGTKRRGNARGLPLIGKQGISEELLRLFSTLHPDVFPRK